MTIKNLIIVVFSISLSTNLMAMVVSDDPIVSKLTIDRLEMRSSNGETENVLEGEFWIGKDLNKLWAKFEIEGLGQSTSESSISLWYSKAKDAYWDYQYGIKSVNHPTESRLYAGVALKGLAPYWIETDISLMLGENSQVIADLSFEYEYMITQKLVVIPGAKFNLFTTDDTALEVGSGLSSSEIGVRVAYEFKREFAPYIGVNFTNKYGKTADIAKEDNLSVSNTQLVVGLHMWL
jgi:copper resistance protein B